jgi:flavin-dependent dehydrogenase
MQIHAYYDLAVIGGSFAGLIAVAAAAARGLRVMVLQSKERPDARDPAADEAESAEQLAAPCLFP